MVPQLLGTCLFVLAIEQGHHAVTGQDIILHKCDRVKVCSLQHWPCSDTDSLTSSGLVRAVAEPGFHQEDDGQLWQVAIPWLQQMGCRSENRWTSSEVCDL